MSASTGCNFGTSRPHSPANRISTRAPFFHGSPATAAACSTQRCASGPRTTAVAASSGPGRGRPLQEALTITRPSRERRRNGCIECAYDPSEGTDDLGSAKTNRLQAPVSAFWLHASANLHLPTMSRRRRRPSKPLIPGLRWMIFLFVLLAVTFGLFGVLSHWTVIERVTPEATAP